MSVNKSCMIVTTSGAIGLSQVFQFVDNDVGNEVY